MEDDDPYELAFDDFDDEFVNVLDGGEMPNHSSGDDLTAFDGNFEFLDEPAPVHVHVPAPTPAPAPALSIPPSYTWAPFPISLKAQKTGQHHRIPSPRIGSVVLDSAGNTLTGHVFYAESIQDMPNRRDQSTKSFDKVFVIPPLSSHAVCLNCAEVKRGDIAMAGPAAPAPPYGITMQNDRIQYCSMGNVRTTKLTNGRIVPYVRVFFVSMNPSLEAGTGQKDVPREVELAFRRMEHFIGQQYGAFALNLTPENDGLDSLYDPPEGMKSRWMTTVFLAEHKDVPPHDVINVFNHILYFTRGVSRCRAGEVPVYVAYSQMKRTMYAWRTLPRRPPQNGRRIAYAIPPLFNYKTHPLCDASQMASLQPRFSFYTKNGSSWEDHVYENVRKTVNENTTTITMDQCVQWFASNIYNRVYTTSHGHDDDEEEEGDVGLDVRLFRHRLDNTRYPIPDAADVVSDLYWALFPDNVQPPEYWDVSGVYEAELSQLLAKKREALHRLDWYARYSVVFEKETSYQTHEQEGYGPLERDAHVFWTKPSLLRVPAHPTPEEKSARDAAASEDNIGLFFVNVYGLPREFPTPVEGRYVLTDGGVFIRNNTGDYMFVKNDPFVRPEDRIWYGYRRKAVGGTDTTPGTEICLSRDDRARRTTNFFYKINKYNQNGTADPRGIYSSSWSEVAEPITLYTYTLNRNHQFEVAQTGTYRYVKTTDNPNLFQDRDDLTYFRTRADRSEITVPFREIYGNFVYVDAKNSLETSQMETRGWFVLVSDLTKSNRSGHDCSF